MKFFHVRRDYQGDKWFYNAGQVPATILKKETYLAHVVDKKLGTKYPFNELYNDAKWNDWKSYETIHTLINHRHYTDPSSHIKEFNETNIWKYDRAYGRMCRTVLKKANVFVPTNNDYLKDF